jgi:nitroreductase
VNEVLRVIASRRSVRAYLPDQVPEEALKAVLTAAAYAPSGQNAQPWFLTVLQHPTAISRVND